MRARERAYRAYRACGDSGGAGRVAAWLAADFHEFRGDDAVARGWLERSHRLLDRLAESADHGWLALHEGSLVLSVGGDAEEAARLARRAAGLGRTFGVADLEAVGLALEGITLVLRGHVAEGMRSLDEASAIADVHERLRSGARVADLGSGTGWSSIAIARAYPEVSVDGFDVDSASVEKARANARAERLEDRVRFVVQDASDPSLGGSYELVTIFEALHDMGRPVEALANARRLLAAGGTVIVADERVADRFTAPGDDLERIMYGFSVIHCLAVGRADHDDSAATGTAMRPQTLREYARAAGFRHVEILPIENDFWRFYRLDP